MAESNPPNGAQLIAQTLLHLEVKVIFGIVGIPIIEVAEACIALGIRFIAFRNEQAASYAASAFGYLTGRPGVLLVVGGPGVVHALSGVCFFSVSRRPSSRFNANTRCFRFTHLKRTSFHSSQSAALIHPPINPTKDPSSPYKLQLSSLHTPNSPSNLHRSTISQKPYGNPTQPHSGVDLAQHVLRYPATL